MNQDIIFYNNLGDDRVEVLRITKEGIAANPDVPTDEAADAVIRVLDGHIKSLTKRTWVGLTDEEIDKTYETQVWDARRSYARALEAKLKQKNGYNT